MLPGFRDVAAVETVGDRAAAIMEAFDPAGVQAIFTTREQEHFCRRSAAMSCRVSVRPPATFERTSALL